MKSVKIATMMLLAMVLPACSDSDEGKGEGDNSLQPRVEITLTRSESVTMNKQNNFGFKMLKNVVNSAQNSLPSLEMQRKKPVRKPVRKSVQT